MDNQNGCQLFFCEILLDKLSYNFISFCKVGIYEFLAKSYTVEETIEIKE